MKALLTALALTLLATPALAHGDRHPARSTATAKAEQMPWGIAAPAQAKARTIELQMRDDMRFVPERIQVRQGETVRLVLRNTGQVMHELVIGTQKTLAEHAALMLKFPTMEHDEPYMAHVAPGQSGEIRWTFNRAGEFDFACLIAGHYQAGMVGKISVTAK